MKKHSTFAPVLNIIESYFIKLSKMKKVLILFSCLFLWGNHFTLADKIPVEVEVEIIDDTPSCPGHSKTPLRIPRIYKDGHTLSFSSYHPEYIINIVQEGETVFSAIIPASATQFELPAFISGECTVQFVAGRFCLTGYVQL